MKVELRKEELSNALAALGKMVSRMSPVEAYKSVLIEATNKSVAWSVCSSGEMLTCELDAVNPEANADTFRVMTPYAQWREFIKGGGKGTVTLEYTGGVLNGFENGRGNGRMVTFTPGELENWPKIEYSDLVQQSVLPDVFMKALSECARIVNLNEPRRSLQGIHLGPDGMTAANGKELCHVSCAFHLDPVTLPFPLALLGAKIQGSTGEIKTWQTGNGNSRVFELRIGNWTWFGKAIDGAYPNWRAVIPSGKSLDYLLEFGEESVGSIRTFLKRIPEKKPYAVIRLKGTGINTLSLRSQEDPDQNIDVEGVCSGKFTEAELFLRKECLVRLLDQGHRQIQSSSSDYVPIIATGGLGQYIAMPLHCSRTRTAGEASEASVKSNNPPSNIPKEENPMVANNTPSGSVSEQTAHPETETVQPMDDLTATIESFRIKLKAALDESSNLSRKVKEVQLAQKQKERDFIQARRAIERIRMVSGF